MWRDLSSASAVLSRPGVPGHILAVCGKKKERDDTHLKLFGIRAKNRTIKLEHVRLVSWKRVKKVDIKKMA